MSILQKREFLFPQWPGRSFGPNRGNSTHAAGFTLPQRDHIKDRSGESEEGRQRAKALRRKLRDELGRRPTAKEYRAAKKAA